MNRERYTNEAAVGGGRLPLGRARETDLWDPPPVG